MVTNARTGRDEEVLRRELLSEFVNRRITSESQAVPVRVVFNWFPRHEHTMLVVALGGLVAEETPMTPSTEGSGLLLESLEAGRGLLNDLNREFPHWFE